MFMCVCPAFVLLWSYGFIFVSVFACLRFVHLYLQFYVSESACGYLSLFVCFYSYVFVCLCIDERVFVCICVYWCVYLFITRYIHIMLCLRMHSFVVVCICMLSCAYIYIYICMFCV